MYSEDIGRFLSQGPVGMIAYFVLANSVMLIVPVLLIAWAGRILKTSRHRIRDGLLHSFAVALWASLCWLTVPYCGGYPNLPSLMVSSLFFAPPVNTLPHELTIHALNFLIWPLLEFPVFLLPAGRT